MMLLFKYLMNFTQARQITVFAKKKKFCGRAIRYFMQSIRYLYKYYAKFTCPSVGKINSKND